MRQGLRGNFKGLVATFARDVPQYAIFFSTFEMIRQSICRFTKSKEMTLG